MIRKSWRTKIVLHGLLASALIMMVFITISVSAHRSDIQRLTEQKIEILTTTVVRATTVSMLAGRPTEIQSTVESLAVHPDIKRIRIFAPDGRIVASSRPEEIGARVEVEYVERGRAASARTSGTEMRTISDTVHQVRVIENQPRCHGCHSPKQPVNGYLDLDIDVAASLSLLRTAQWRSVLLGGLVALLMTFVILRLMDRLVHQPVVELCEKMALAAAGNLEHSVAVPRDDEIGSLAASYNELVVELKRAKENIEESHMRDLQRAEQLATLGQLATGLAHEIRNPLAGIKGALEVIRAEMPAGSGFQEIMNEVLQQIDRINATVGDLLTYARPREPQRSRQDVNAIADSVVKFSENKIRGKRISLGIEAGDVPAVEIDPEQIRQVLVNLILNSIQSIDGSGTITVKTSPSEDGHVLLSVCDTGRGIKPEHLRDVFRPFFTTKAQGTGLGLSISRGIIEKHGGTLTIDSIVGEGTTVSIRLPVCTT